MKLPAVYKDLSWRERRAVREEYVKRQEGKCYFCETPLKNAPPEDITNKPIRWEWFPPNFLKHPVHLQHDHESGKTEGAVHALCNAWWWQHYGR